MKWLTNLIDSLLVWGARNYPVPATASTVIKTVDGVDITYRPGLISFTADADIDSDGGPNIDHDPYWQPDTTLHHHGQPINAQRVPYCVIPIGILNKVPEMGLGCHCVVTNTRTGQSATAVLADLGPTRKIGEISPALARKIGVNPNSRIGGEERKIILYEIYVGNPATIDGITYKLQPLGRK